jgi:hypothetical protein
MPDLGICLPAASAIALVRFLEQAALAVVATDPIGALRLALLASELRPTGGGERA